MSINNLEVVNERLCFDDHTLVDNYYKIKKDYKSKKCVFENNLRNLDENDYLRFALARLQYEFVKEEYDIFHSEIIRRNLRDY